MDDCTKVMADTLGRLVDISTAYKEVLFGPAGIINPATAQHQLLPEWHAKINQYGPPTTLALLSHCQFAAEGAKVIFLPEEPLTGIIKSSVKHLIMNGGAFPEKRLDVMMVLDSVMKVFGHKDENNLKGVDFSGHVVDEWFLEELQHILVPSNPSDESAKHIEHLYFNNCGLSDHKIAILAKYILGPNALGLKTLCLNRNRITPPGAGVLCRFLKHCFNIERLELGVKPLVRGTDEADEDEVEADAMPIVRALSATSHQWMVNNSTSKLSRLVIHETNFSRRTSSNHSQSVDIVAASTLAMVIMASPMRHLDLQYCDLNRTEVSIVLRALIEAPGVDLKYLDLSGSDLSGGNTELLTVMLERDTLEELRADSSNVGNNSFHQILNQGNVCQSMRTISLQTNDITFSGGIDLLFESHHIFLNVEEMDLRDNAPVSPEDAARIKATCPGVLLDIFDGEVQVSLF